MAQRAVVLGYFPELTGVFSTSSMVIQLTTRLASQSAARVMLTAMGLLI